MNDQKLQDALFEVRFAKPLDDDWGLNDRADDIDTLWRLLASLPPSNVEGNVMIDEIALAPGEGGGWYEPNTHDIYIGSRSVNDKEGFEDIVRHEVGHGVHEQRKTLVDGWLEQAFGWRMLAPTSAGLDVWVDLMGGWEQWSVSARQRPEIASFINQAIGPGGGWKPGSAPNAPTGHPWLRPDFGPRLAFEATGPHWYDTHQLWYRRNGRAFFLNYYYRTLCVIDETALALVDQMPSKYAAMSSFEFFAELYALYYDINDPLRVAIPATAIAWMDANIGGALQPAQMMPGPPPQRDPWEDIARPAGESAA